MTAEFVRELRALLRRSRLAAVAIAAIERILDREERKDTSPNSTAVRYDD